MPRLGSSPLGLIMDTSADSNIRLGSYTANLNPSVGPGMDFYTSLFGREGREGDGAATVNFSYTQDNNDLFDISTQSIVEYCNNHPMMKLSYADFAYLKKLGVYPNNRLIIARRFAAAVDDDLINNDNEQTYPLATLISWVPDGDNFFEVQYNEDWVEADTSFTDLLNEASNDKDVLSGDISKKPLGTFLAEGASAIPLPGWSEGLQYELFKQLGLTDLDATQLPFGNPNLIRQAKMRATAPKKGPFSGVKATINVKMVVEYEQKFINKLDPTGVYYDIIANALSFGTSNSMFMFRSDALGANGEFARFLNDLGSGDNARVKSALITFANKLGAALKAVAEALQSILTETFEKQDEQNAANTNTDGEENVEEKPDASERAYELIQNSLFTLLSKVIAGVVSKYKIRILGILDALTGSPSAPWHVTIGNPKRPIFSSGDMLVKSVDVSFGKLLAYNDLPSTVTITVNLSNARDLGGQEIFRKLNCGKARSYQRIRFDIASAPITITQAEIDSLGTYSVRTDVGQSPEGSGTNASTPVENNLSFFGQGILAGAQLAGATGSEAEAARAALIIRYNRRQNFGATGATGSGPQVRIPPEVQNRLQATVNVLSGTSSNTSRGTNNSTRNTRNTQTVQRPRTSDRGPNDVKEYAEEKQAIAAHNRIINAIESVLTLSDSFSRTGGPILRENPQARQNEALAVSIIRSEVLNKLKSQVDTARKWDMVSINLDIALDAIYKGVSSGSRSISVPFFNTPTARVTVSKQITPTYKSN